LSDDPETVRQIEELSRDTRPLLVCDIDEVVLEFVGPLIGFLNARKLHLKTDSFRLHGNVVDIETGEAIDAERVSALLEDFFAAQDEWQSAVLGASDSLARLSESAEIVLLTAMPHRHRARRRRLLDSLRFPYPLLTTETPKGPAIQRLRGETDRPVAFVDDIPHNLVSVRKSVPEAGLVHLMAFSDLLPLLPPIPADITMADNWPQAESAIADILGL
jgi:hypothetical protein